MLLLLFACRRTHFNDAAAVYLLDHEGNRGPTEQQLKISSDWLLFVLGVGVGDGVSVGLVCIFLQSESESES